MISVGDLRPGITFEYEGNLYVVLDYSHNKTARAAANIKVKMKNMRSGATTEITFGGNDKVKKAHIDKRKMQYLYNSGDALVFMDNETYEQIEIPAEGEVLGVSLPINVPFTITETEPAVKGDTATGATKNAIIETGFQIKVPLFISEGEVVIVNTVDGKYQGRA